VSVYRDITVFIWASCVVNAALAGPLDPPVGPIESTGKTLTQIEPRIAINSTNTPGDDNATFVIRSSGSYYLTGNVPPTIFTPIEIAPTARDVTIDMMGFSIRVQPGSTGILAENNPTGIVVVRNGVLRLDIGFGGTAIDLTLVGSAVIEDVRVERLQSGLLVGDNASIRRCDVVDILGNNAVGIQTGFGSTVENCRVRDVTGAGDSVGIRVGGSSVVRDCIVTCSDLGEVGIDAGTGGIVERNVIRCDNDATAFRGIVSAGASIIRGNLITAVAAASATGVSSASVNTIQNNTFSACDTGVALGTSVDCLVTGNHFRLSSTAVQATSPALNIIGPTITSGGAAASNNPHANYVQ
jgi:parallel beta-helix repeat protein